MSIRADERTVTIEHLDFTPLCEGGMKVEECGRVATHGLLCASCGDATGVACVAHVKWARKSSRQVRHTVCGATGAVRDLVKVVPL